MVAILNLPVFILIDEPIDLSIQEEYLSFSETIDLDNFDYKEVLMESDKLFYKDTPIESRKKILILLAHLGTPESCRILEKYLKSPEVNLRDWALLSLKECRMLLESVLLKEEGGFVPTGLECSWGVESLSLNSLDLRFNTKGL